MNGWNTLSLLGMAEMESVVEDMLDMAKERLIPFNEVAFSIDDYVKKSPYRAIGLAHLCWRGLLEERWSGCYHGSWGPSQELTRKIIERHPEMGSLGPSYKERLEKISKGSRKLNKEEK